MNGRASYPREVVGYSLNLSSRSKPLNRSNSFNDVISIHLASVYFFCMAFEVPPKLHFMQQFRGIRPWALATEL